MTDLRLEAVSKRYGERDETAAIALQEIDLTVRDGEFFTLVGPSGCGKTTTLRTIAGFEELTAGSVHFDGTEMTGVAPEDRDVGVVFQSYALFPHMTVAENVGYGLRFRAPPAGTDADDRITELLELVDLPELGDREPGQLSGGQQQRVALARALAPAPDLLLLDEPMSALDAQLRESLRRQLTEIQSELGITTVYVTHDQAEALAISDRVAVMNDGQVEQVATPQTLYQEPATRFVAEFIGDNNVFQGAVRATEASVQSDGGTVHDQHEEATVAVGTETFTLPAVPNGTDRVTFCVRPGALSQSADRNRIPVTVETSEFLGETVRVTGRWNGRPIVLQLETVPERDELTVGFDPAAVHVIETE